MLDIRRRRNNMPPVCRYKLYVSTVSRPRGALDDLPYIDSVSLQLQLAEQPAAAEAA